MTTESSPTVRGLLLARELKARRVRAGLKPAEVWPRLGWSQSKLSRIEGARILPSSTDVRQALELYGANTADTEVLLKLTRDAGTRGWWQQYNDVFTGSFVGLEQGASMIRCYQAQLVPGLLQTPRYTRAVQHACLINDEAVIQQRVQARMNRQEVLRREPSPLRLHVVLDEAVLQRPLGGEAVMREQLRHLLESAGQPNISIRVLPFSAGGHAAVEGPFLIMSFAEREDLEIAYVEGFAGDVYLESADQIGRCNVTFERVYSAALSETESAAMIAALIKE